MPSEFVGPKLTDPSGLAARCRHRGTQGRQGSERFNAAILALRQRQSTRKSTIKYFDFDVYGE